jgi:hypothetical protein
VEADIDGGDFPIEPNKCLLWWDTFCHAAFLLQLFLFLFSFYLAAQSLDPFASSRMLVAQLIDPLRTFGRPFHPMIFSLHSMLYFVSKLQSNCWLPILTHISP